jgi:hypothetical protein
VAYFPALAILSMIIWILKFVPVYLGYSKNTNASQMVFDSEGYFFLLIFFFVVYPDLRKKVVKRNKWV